jgi:multiple sugar transport system substrate-binding protein
MVRRSRLAARLSAAAALVVALVATAACSGPSGQDDGPTSGAGRTLHIAEVINSTYPEEQRVWQQRIAERFRAATGAEVQFEVMQSAADEQTRIQTSVVSNTGPDIFVVGTTLTPVAYSTGAFESLTDEDWAAIGGRERFFGPQLAMSGPDPANQIGVPMSMRPFGLVYNTEMFAQAGIAAPPRTWDEFLATARALNRPEQGVYGTALGYSDNFDPWKFIWTFALQSGGRLVSDDLRTAQLDSPQVQQAVQQYFGLLTEHGVISPDTVSWEGAQALAAFANGEAAMVAMVTPTAVPTLTGSAVDGKYAFAPMPTVPFGATALPSGGVAAGTIVSGNNMAIAQYSDNKDLALRYIELVTNDEEQAHFHEVFGDIPANQAAAGALAQNDPQVQAFIDAEETAIPTSFTGAWADVQIGLTNVVTQSMPGLANRTYDPAAIQRLLAEADATVQRSLDRQRPS